MVDQLHLAADNQAPPNHLVNVCLLPFAGARVSESEVFSSTDMAGFPQTSRMTVVFSLQSQPLAELSYSYRKKNLHVEIWKLPLCCD